MSVTEKQAKAFFWSHGIDFFSEASILLLGVGFGPKSDSLAKHWMSDMTENIIKRGIR